MDEEEAESLRQDVRIHPVLILLSSVPSSPRSSALQSAALASV